MSERKQYEFVVVKYVTNVLSGDALTIGLAMCEPGEQENGFLQVRFTKDWERLLHAEGFRQVRVREHGECARVEVEEGEIARLLDDALRTRIVDGLRNCGYAFVALDLEGFASGKLNRLVPAAERQDAP